MIAFIVPFFCAPDKPKHIFMPAVHFLLLFPVHYVIINMLISRFENYFYTGKGCSMDKKELKNAAKELKSGIKAGLAENKENMREVKGELKKIRRDIKKKADSDEVKELAAKKDAILMEGAIKKEKVEADIKKLKEDAELKAQVMREAAEAKKSKQ